MFGTVAGLPWFLLYFACGLALMGLFSAIYLRVTPHDELALIRVGNGAAVIGFLGAVLGFSLPLASAAAHSVSLLDFIVWALIGMALQVLAYLVASRTMNDLPGRITRGEVPAGAWAGGVALATGLLNAACMTY